MQQLKKIVIIGPESTGKSTLCKQLATHYNAICCREYAREYLLKYGKNYTYDDLLIIAKGQVALEDDHISKALNPRKSENTELKNPLLFVDTDMYVMKVWCEYVFRQCHTYILDKITERICDVYLLCNVDLPWVKDELREYPDVQSRMELYHMYKDILINQNVPWAIISGNYEERFRMAIRSIDHILFSRGIN